MEDIVEFLDHLKYSETFKHTNYNKILRTLKQVETNPSRDVKKVALISLERLLR